MPLVGCSETSGNGGGGGTGGTGGTGGIDDPCTGGLCVAPEPEAFCNALIKECNANVEVGLTPEECDELGVAYCTSGAGGTGGTDGSTGGTDGSTGGTDGSTGGTDGGTGGTDGGGEPCTEGACEKASIALACQNFVVFCKAVPDYTEVDCIEIAESVFCF